MMNSYGGLRIRNPTKQKRARLNKLLQRKRKRSKNLKTLIKTRLSKLKKDLSKSESLIEKFETQKEEIEKDLGNPDHFNDIDKLNKLNQLYEEVQKNLEEANNNWETIAVDIDDLES